MTQNKTSLILNNLVELKIPLGFKNQSSFTTQDQANTQNNTNSQSKFVSINPGREPNQICVNLKFPCSFLLQKVLLSKYPHDGQNKQHELGNDEESVSPNNDQLKLDYITKHTLKISTHNFGSKKPALFTENTQKSQQKSANMTQQNRLQTEESEVLDFKKEKIDWRFKARMRSNSNEFLESPTSFQKSATTAKHQYLKSQANLGRSGHSQSKLSQNVRHNQQLHYNSRQIRDISSDSENTSIQSSDSELAATKNDQFSTQILVTGLSNWFSLYFSLDTQDDKNNNTEEKEKSSQSQKPQIDFEKLRKAFKLQYKSVTLSVWPCFRMPTGSSAIALINTSFLLASKGLEVESIEAEFLAGLSLIAGRKFIQASEKLRKIEGQLLKQITNRSLEQAMLIELIIGESMNQHTQISEKIYAFQRVVTIYHYLKKLNGAKKNQMPSFSSQGINFDNQNESDLQNPALLQQNLTQLSKQRKKVPLKQQEAFKSLLKISPSLINVLLAFLESDIEVVRLSTLKTLEFLIDSLGCSLDYNIITIFRAIVNQYPSKIRVQHRNFSSRVASFFDEFWVPFKDQDYRDNQSENIRNSGNVSRSTLTDQLLFGNDTTNYNNQSFQNFEHQPNMVIPQESFFILANLNSLEDCTLTDSPQKSLQAALQGTKNFYNHILVCLLNLTSSLSTNMLQTLFKESIEPVLFQKFGIDSDLRQYLFKFAAKIIRICRGQLKLSQEFLNSIFHQIIFDKEQQINVDFQKSNQIPDSSMTAQMKDKKDQQNNLQFHKIAVCFWQTLKQSYFTRLSSSEQIELIKWVSAHFTLLIDKFNAKNNTYSGASSIYTENLNNSCSQATTAQNINNYSPMKDQQLNKKDQQKLLLLLDLTNLLIMGVQTKSIGLHHNTVQSRAEGNCENNNNLSGFGINGTSQSKRFNPCLQEISGRNVNDSFDFVSILDDSFDLQRNTAGIFSLNDMNNLERQLNHKFTSNSSIMNQQRLVELEICSLIDPLLFWLNFTIEKQNRLPYFKVLWRTLSNFVKIMPSKKEIGFEFDLILVIIPQLNRVQSFCQSSSPSLPMLTFLNIVFDEIGQSLVKVCRSRTRKALAQFLSSFIFTFAKVIPHNLHDEVFEVCRQVLDLAGSLQILNCDHIHQVLDALIHKYTMRSKAHKSLSDYVIKKWILNESVKQIELHTQLTLFRFVATNDENQVIGRARSMSQDPQTLQGLAASSHIINSAEALIVESDEGKNNNLENPISTEHPSNPAPQQAISGPNAQNQKHQMNENKTSEVHPAKITSTQHLNCYFDTFCDFSFFKVSFDSKRKEDQFVGELDIEQKCQEKLSFMQDMLEKMGQEHMTLFTRLITRTDFQDSLLKVFSHEETRSKLIKLLKTLTEFYLRHRSEVNRAEYPLINPREPKIDKMEQEMANEQQHEAGIDFYRDQPVFQAQHGSDMVRTSANNGGRLRQQRTEVNSAHHFGAPVMPPLLNSEPSIDLLQAINQEEELDVEGFDQRNPNQINIEPANAAGLQPQRLYQSLDANVQLRSFHNQNSSQVDRQQNYLFNANNEIDQAHRNGSVQGIVQESSLSEEPNMVITDSVVTLNTERLILIKGYSILVRFCLEIVGNQQSQLSRGAIDQNLSKIGNDALTHLQLLNILELLMFHLCPVPTFQNTVVRTLLTQEPNVNEKHDERGANNSIDPLEQANQKATKEVQIASQARLQFQFSGLNSMMGSQLGLTMVDQQAADVIPDFETMHIRFVQDPVTKAFKEDLLQSPADEILGKKIGGNGENVKQNGKSENELTNCFPEVFECWDLRYLHARIALAFKVWPFLESVIQTSNWVSVRSACFVVLCNALRIPDVTMLSKNYQSQLKQNLFPLLNKLLKNEDSESRAAGLNILANFCGLTGIQRQQSLNGGILDSDIGDENYSQNQFQMHPDNNNEEQTNYDLNENQRQQRNGLFDSEVGYDYNYECYLEGLNGIQNNQYSIKVKDHLKQFHKNSQFVSLAIWQEVFQLQDDRDASISQAAQILIQISAPKDSVLHFYKLSQERVELSLSEAKQRIKTLDFVHLMSSLKKKVSLEQQILPKRLEQTLNVNLDRQDLLLLSVRSQEQAYMNRSGKATHTNLIRNSTTINSQRDNNCQNATTNLTKTLKSQQATLFNQDFNLRSIRQAQQNNIIGGLTLEKQADSSDESEEMGTNDEESQTEKDIRLEKELFYMRHIPESRLRSLLQIFQLRFKPVDGLWIEKQASRNQAETKIRQRAGSMGDGTASVGTLSSGVISGGFHFTEDTYDENSQENQNSQNIIADLFEDNMLEEVHNGFIQEEDEKDSELIVDEHLVEEQIQTNEMTRMALQKDSDSEDLGIIDLDKDGIEGSDDVFAELDDDKLPILKNTYIKKNRPNNSKSVAIGSRSQGGAIKIRTVANSQSNYDQEAHQQRILPSKEMNPEQRFVIKAALGAQDSHEFDQIKRTTGTNNLREIQHKGALSEINELRSVQSSGKSSSTVEFGEIQVQMGTQNQMSNLKGNIPGFKKFSGKIGQKSQLKQASQSERSPAAALYPKTSSKTDQRTKKKKSSQNQWSESNEAEDFNGKQNDQQIEDQKDDGIRSEQVFHNNRYDTQSEYVSDAFSEVMTAPIKRGRQFSSQKSKNSGSPPRTELSSPSVVSGAHSIPVDRISVSMKTVESHSDTFNSEKEKGSTDLRTKFKKESQRLEKVTGGTQKSQVQSRVGNSAVVSLSTQKSTFKNQVDRKAKIVGKRPQDLQSSTQAFLLHKKGSQPSFIQGQSLVQRQSKVQQKSYLAGSYGQTISQQQTGSNQAKVGVKNSVSHPQYTMSKNTSQKTTNSLKIAVSGRVTQELKKFQQSSGSQASINATNSNSNSYSYQVRCNPYKINQHQEDPQSVKQTYYSSTKPKMKDSASDKQLKPSGKATSLTRKSDLGTNNRTSTLIAGQNQTSISKKEAYLGNSKVKQSTVGVQGFSSQNSNQQPQIQASLQQRPNQQPIKVGFISKQKSQGLAQQNSIDKDQKMTEIEDESAITIKVGKQIRNRSLS